METKIVKQVITSDGLVLRDRPRGGPPVEYTVYLSYITTPKLARVKDGEFGQDEPFAWEAREYLRQLLIGREVRVREDYKLSGANFAATIYLIDDDESVNLKLVKAGFSEVNRKKQLADNGEIRILQDAETEAKTAGVGRWSNESPRIMRSQILNEISKEAADKLVNQKLEGIVEHVKDGSSFKVGVFFPLNKPKEERTIYQLISVNLSGIKCPPLKDDHGEEAKFFTESRLLNRDVFVHIEQVQSPNFVSFIGSILFNDRNIALFLLKEGFARTVDRTIGLVQGGIEKYREAERSAKLSKSRIWKNEITPTVRANDSKNQFEGEVVEIINAESIIVERKSDKELIKIWFSSIRGPKADASKFDANKKVIPLYNTPFMFDAREFLRKKLIGKTVQVKIDYEQARTEQFPQKICATVFLGEINVAVALVLKGFATVIKRSDDQKSYAFDDLLEAESKAQKSNKGLFAKNPKVKPIKPIEVSADVNRAQFQLETLSKGAPKDAIVEYVFSSSKLKCYLPKENLLINFVVSGVLVEKTGKNDENAKIVKRLLQHREVKLSFERIDKAGNFIGTLKFELESYGLVSLAYYLVKEGLLKIRDEKDAQLLAAQTDAQSKRKGVWVNYEEHTADDEEESKETDFENADDEKKDFVDVFEVKGLKKGVLSIVLEDALTLYIQKVEHGVALDELMSNLREDLSNNPPLAGAYRPKQGDYCAAIFKEDGLWYRAQVDKVNPIDKTVDVNYIDYGNKATVKFVNEVCALPGSKYGIISLPPVAQLYGLAYVYLPKNDSDAIEDARLELESRLNNGKELLIKPEYKLSNGQEQITLIDPETKEDLILNLVKEGFYCVEKRNIYGKNRKLTEKQFNKYKEAMEKALSERLNLWRYGDIREDDNL